MEKEMIYTVKIDLEATNKALKEYESSITSIAKSQGELNVSTKEAQEQARRQEAASKRTKEALQGEENSIKALREENKKLTEQRNAVNTSTEEGQKRIRELNKQIDENNDKIKENVDAYTKQKMGIGAYKDAILESIPFYRQASQATEVMTAGVKGFTKALIATGIGLFVAALGALIAYFKGSEEGQNKLNAAMNVAKMIMEKLMDVAENVGKVLVEAFESPGKALRGIVNFIENNFMNRIKAFAVIWEGITNLDFKQVGNGLLQLGTGIEDVIGKTQNLWEGVKKTFNEAVDQANSMSKLMAQIDREERDMLVARAQTNLEVSRLRKQAISQEGQLKEDTIRKAIALEEQLADKEMELAERKLRLAKLDVEAKGNDKEALKALAEAEANYINAQARRFEATIRFEKQLEALRDEQEKARLDREENELKEREKRRKAFVDRMERDQQTRQKKQEKDAKDLADKEKKIEEIKGGGIQNIIKKTLGDRVDAQKLYTSIFKKGALAETLANTKAAAIAAYKALAVIPIIGPILGIAAAGAATVYGMAQVTGISAIGFAKGGRALSGTRVMPWHGTPIRRSNGDNLLATIKTNEVILNEEQQARLGGAKTFRAIGVPGFATGGRSLMEGAETQMALDTIESTISLSKIQEAVKSVQPILVLQDFEAVQMSRNVVSSKARVIG